MNARVAKTDSPSKTNNAPRAHGVGRRKKSVARVWLRRGSGIVTVNGSKVNDYFDTVVTRNAVAEPMAAFAPAATFNVEANVKGGGLSGQADAVKLAIARAIVSLDDRARVPFRERGLLTVDARVKERKKYGQKAARRKFQFVKR